MESDGCHTRGANWIPGTNATTSPEAATNYFDFPYYLTQGTWSAPMTNRLLLEAGLSRFSYYHAGGPGQVPPDGIFDLISVTEQSTAIDPATGIRYAPRANYAYRAVPTYNDNYGNPNHWRASASYVTGAHNMKVGYQGSWLIAKSKLVTPESLVQYRFNLGVPNAYSFRLPDWEQTDHTKVAAFYVQDTWTMGRLTLAGALRYDRAWSYSPADGNGTTKTSIFNSSAITYPETAGVSALQRHHTAYRCRVRHLRQRQDGHQVQLRPLPRLRHERQHLHAEQPGEQDRAPGAEPFLGRQRSGQRDRL